MNPSRYVVLELDAQSRTALLFMPLAAHRYCVAHGFDRAKGDWSHGTYTDKIERAAKEYRDAVRARKRSGR